MPLYCGVNGVRREIKELYTGVGGVRKELTEIWAAEGGVKKMVYQKKSTIGGLPVGSIVKMGKYYGEDISWIVADHNHSGYPENSTTLVSERILTIKSFDATESGGDTDRKNAGNGRYIWSNIRQWLNKLGAGWYQSQHDYDRPPSNDYVWANLNEYDTEQGFLTGFSTEMISKLLPTELTVARSRVDGEGYDIFTDKVFLLSMEEVGLGANNGIHEGSKLSLFSDNNSRNAFPTEQSVNNSEYTNESLDASRTWKWWLRSPTASGGAGLYITGVHGEWSSAYASQGSTGVRPAINLPSDVSISGDGYIIP